MKMILVIATLINAAVFVSGQVAWAGNDWALKCDFAGNDLANAKVMGEDCGTSCVYKKDCTHFSWTKHEGGTCWMKKGPIKKSDAVTSNVDGIVCGIVDREKQPWLESYATAKPLVKPQGGNGDFPGCTFKTGRLYGNEWDDYSAFDYLTIWINTNEGSNTEWNQGYQGKMVQTCRDKNKIPMFYAYIIAFEARAREGITDCDVDPWKNYCHFGADFIRRNRGHLVYRYGYQAENIARNLGREKTAVFLIEPDFWQYYGDVDTQQGGALSGEYMRDLFNDFVKEIKKHLPNALISFDISAWIGEDGFRRWWGFFKDSQIDFLHTSGGQARGDMANIKPNELRWQWISQTTGKKIIADCGYGVGGADSANCWPWHNANTINDRIRDGVIGLTQASNPQNIWNKPNVC